MDETVCLLCEQKAAETLIYNGFRIPVCAEHRNFLESFYDVFSELIDSQKEMCFSPDKKPDDFRNLLAMQKLQMLVFTDEILLKEIYESWSGNDFRS